jgi:isoleucyl-tRNA synthetase
VHAVQNARKNAGLNIEDRIELAIGGDQALIAAAAAHTDYLAGETLAVVLTLGEDAAMDYSEQTDVDGLPLSIGLRRAAG